MEKATKILGRIVGISLMVLSILGLVFMVIDIIGVLANGGIVGDIFSGLILPLIIMIAELVIGILLLNSVDKIRFLVCIILAIVLIVIERFVGLFGSFLAAATLFGFISDTIPDTVYTILSYYLIALLIVGIVALALKIVLMVKAK